MKLAPASKLATVSLDDKYAAETGRVFRRARRRWCACR
jgi:hypothetical protein